MSRSYQVFDANGSAQFYTEDLPLIIGSDSSAHIRINDNKRIAYIAEHEGHLFIQLADEKVEIFHNEERLKGSRWIKSRDISRLKKQIIHYIISPDRVEITIQDIPDKVIPSVTAETLPSIPGAAKPGLPRSSIAKQANNNDSNKQFTVLNYTIYVLLAVLLLFAAYILMAKSIEIKPVPETASVKLSGFPPPIKIANRYLLTSGEFSLRVEKPGYKTHQEKIKVADNDETINISLDELPGKLKLNFKPDSGKLKFPGRIVIFINNKQYRGNPEQAIELDSGEHVIEIRREWYKKVIKTVQIQGRGKEQATDIELVPNWGLINIDTQPAGADISAAIDIQQHSADLTHRVNQLTATSAKSPASMELQSGHYKLKIDKDKYKQIEKEIEINAGEIQQLPVITLEPADAYINLNVAPENVMVFLNGKYLGMALKRIKIASTKQQNITLRSAGYMDEDIKVALEPAEEQTIDVRLEAEMGSVFINTYPPDASLYIDGYKQNKNNGRFRISARQHTIKASAAGYISKTFYITPDTAFSQKIDVLLEPEKLITNHNAATNKQQKTYQHNNLSQYKTFAGNKMILLNGAKFTMGTARNEIGRRSNERLRKVNLTYKYYLSDKEISNKQYRLFNASHNSGSSKSKTLNNDNQPVVNVSWNDAARYCNWLSVKEGLQPYYKERNGKMVAAEAAGNRKKDDGYRLPFESEWSYAARVSHRSKISRYPWSGSYPPDTLSGNFADESARAYLSSVIKGYNDNHSVAAPIGTFGSNPAGFYDMGGNVREWCHDFYSASSDLSGSYAVAVNPQGPETGRHHVVRDSSWRNASITELRLAYRSYSMKAQDDIGFRIARYAP